MVSRFLSPDRLHWALLVSPAVARPPPGGCCSGCFRRLLADPSAPGKKVAFTVVKRGRVLGRSVRTDRWRYTQWDGGKEGTELYDHRRDPGECRNLAEAPAHRETIAALAKLLRR